MLVCYHGAGLLCCLSAAHMIPPIFCLALLGPLKIRTLTLESDGHDAALQGLGADVNATRVQVERERDAVDSTGPA